MTRALCGIFFGIVITREDFKEAFKSELNNLFREKKKKKMEDIDDFLDDAWCLKRVEKKLFSKEGITLILSSDNYDSCDDRVDDMIIGIELKVVNIRKKKGPTRFDLADEDKTAFTEFLLTASIEKIPKFILRAPV